MAEFTAGLAAGLTAPLLHTYSGEVFTARRRGVKTILLTSSLTQVFTGEKDSHC